MVIFGTDVRFICKRQVYYIKDIKNIFEDGDLSRESTVAKFATVQVIISVGYRVKSQRGVQFRIWATNILKEYIKKVLQWTITA